MTDHMTNQLTVPPLSALIAHEKAIAVLNDIMAEAATLTLDAVVTAAEAVWSDFQEIATITTEMVADVLSRIALLVPAQTAANFAAEEWGTGHVDVKLPDGHFLHWCGEHESLHTTYIADGHLLILTMNANPTLERLA